MKNSKTLRLAQLGLLVAVEIIMAYTPLGYFKTAGLEISFMMVPVTIGAIILGPSAGAILGTVFGLTSFGTCFGASVFGAQLLSISAWKTFVVCVVTRVLAGWLTGVIIKVLHTKNSPQAKKNFSFNVAALAGPLLNTVLFMSALVLFFYNTDYIQGFVTAMGAANPIVFIVAFVGLNGLIEAIVCFVIAGLVSKALYKIIKK